MRAGTSDFLGLLLPLLLMIILLLGAPILFGKLTQRLAHYKGYTGYFWTGFLIGFIGLVYVGFLPNKSQAEQEYGFMDNRMETLLNDFGAEQRSRPMPQQRKPESPNSTQGQYLRPQHIEPSDHPTQYRRTRRTMDDHE